MKQATPLVLVALLVLVLGVSAVVRPEQILLHLTKDSSVVTVSFVTRGGAFKTPVVQYGTSKTKLTKTAACVSDSYNTAPNWDAHGLLHSCKISGVSNLKTYYYRVGSKTKKVYSGVHHFTARHINPTVTKIAIAGDIGSWKDSSQKVVNAIAARNDLGAYVTCGDISYSTFHADVAAKQVKNDNWGVMHSKVLSKIPQVPVYGNHDMYDNKGKVFDHRYNKHVVPSKINQHYFSLVIGGIHLAVIDNLFDQSASSPMVAWLKADLAAAKKQRDAGHIQHIVVTGHYPLYSNGRWTSVVKVLEPIMVAYGVDVYVCGHVHAYQRSYPVNNLGVPASTSKTSYSNPKGVVHVTVGTAGFPLDHAKDKLGTPPKWQVYRERNHYGYLLLSSNKQGKLTVQFIDIAGKVRDAFSITRFNTAVKMAASAPLKRQQVEEEDFAPIEEEENDNEPVLNEEESDEETTTVVEEAEEVVDDNENVEETVATTEESQVAEESEETVATSEESSETEESSEETSDDDSEEVEDSSDDDSERLANDEDDSSAEDDVQTESDGTEEEDDDVVEEESGPEAQALDFGDKFGDAQQQHGWLEQNSNQVEGTDCFEFGNNKWEIAVPDAGVYEAQIELHGNFEDDSVVSVEGELVKASSNLVTVAVHVADGRLTLSSPSSVALCGVKVTVAAGTTVSIDIDPSSPSEFGVDDLDPSTPDFLVTKQTIANGFAKMTGQDASRFVVVSLVDHPTEKGKKNADVLIRDLASDDDLTVSDSLAEFSSLSGDSFWKRSGLQIQRMEVGSSKDLLPKAAQISLLTVVCVIIVVAVVVIAVVLYRRHKKQQALRGEAHLLEMNIVQS